MKTIILPLILSLLLLSCNGSKTAETAEMSIPERVTGQKDVLNLAADPIPIVRVGIIGIGMRGIGAVNRLTYLNDAEIKAISDMEQYNIDRAQNILKKRNKPEAEAYIGDKNTWKKLCERDDIDLVYICTNWTNHAQMAVYAMEQGKHVAVEVPAGLTVDECWQLVNTAEKTQKHCMMLENCCYGLFELATLNMAQQGAFGEIKHVEGAYLHDLRRLTFNDRLSDSTSYIPGIGETRDLPGLLGYYDYWRREYNAEHTGNAYPTHGLGPLCQILNIHRGDKMNFLVSMSSKQIGLTEYAEENFGADSPEAKRDYKMGDMNITLIQTEKGKTIMLQHDESTPRPYSRIDMVVGTKGFAQQFPKRTIALAPRAQRPLSDAAMDSVLMKYEFALVKETKELAKEVGGHGGMDLIMDYRLIYCLKNGLPLDQDVYDAAEWSCIMELSEKSVLNGSKPVQIPDFTRGAWDKVKGYRHAYK